MKEEKWISVIRKDGKEIRFEVRGISTMDLEFDPKDLLSRFGRRGIFLQLVNMAMGWKDTLYFSRTNPTEDRIRWIEEANYNIDRNHFVWNVVTKEELERLKAQLQRINKDDQGAQEIRYLARILTGKIMGKEANFSHDANMHPVVFTMTK